MLIVTTGGTIDKAYFDTLSDYQVADGDREGLRSMIEDSGDARVLVTHGRIR
jgi:hypothetical protein